MKSSLGLQCTCFLWHNGGYRTFTDRLFEIYYKARAVQCDGRLSDSVRSLKVASLEEELCELCMPAWLADLPSGQGQAKDEHPLVNELVRLTLAEQLFTFVTAPAVVQPNGQSQPVAGTKAWTVSPDPTENTKLAMERKLSENRFFSKIILNTRQLLL